MSSKCKVFGSQLRCHGVNAPFAETNLLGKNTKLSAHDVQDLRF